MCWFAFFFYFLFLCLADLSLSLSFISHSQNQTARIKIALSCTEYFVELAQHVAFTQDVTALNLPGCVLEVLAVSIPSKEQHQKKKARVKDLTKNEDCCMRLLTFICVNQLIVCVCVFKENHQKQCRISCVLASFLFSLLGRKTFTSA